MEESGSRYGSASVQIIKDPDSDPGGQKFCKSGSGTLLIRLFKMVVSPSTWKQRGTRCRNRFACRHGSEWRHPRWCRWWWWCPPQLSSPPSRQLMRAGRAGARVSARPRSVYRNNSLFWTVFVKEIVRLIEWLQEIKTADQHCNKFLLNEQNNFFWLNVNNLLKM